MTPTGKVISHITQCREPTSILDLQLLFCYIYFDPQSNNCTGEMFVDRLVDFSDWKLLTACVSVKRRLSRNLIKAFNDQ